MSRRWENLPLECWESIFSLLDHPYYLQSLSLVSKYFLSITNTIRSSLTISDLTVQNLALSLLFLRFPNINNITVDTTAAVHLDSVIRSIARSHLKLRSLDLSGQRSIPISAIKEFGRLMGPTLRILSCRRLQFLDDRDLRAIADSFPLLEILDIGYPLQDLGSSLVGPDSLPSMVTDAGIVELSSKLRNLRCIDVSGNHFVSDKSLIVLSSNCKALAELVVRDCSFVTESGINFVIRRCLKLVSLSVNISKISPFSIECIRSHTRSLSCLDLSRMVISDELLVRIGEAKLPLQKLVISHCQGFTFDGISTLLSTYRSLRHLDLEQTAFLTDRLMLILSDYIHNLISIGLNCSASLTDSTFFNLVKNCRSLEEIHMEKTGLGKEGSCWGLVKNPQIRSLKLAWNKSLSDEMLKGVGSVCPSLRFLDVSHCWSISENGIEEIGKRCMEITELKVNGCAGVHNLGMDMEFLKLEVLEARGSGINDEGLALMAKQGSRPIRMLDLEGCLGVTEKGVKELVGSNCCKGLKILNLKYCCNVSADVLAWMVFSRPSLRKIRTPSDFITTEKKRELFMRHGCMVCES